MSRIPIVTGCSDVEWRKAIGILQRVLVERQDDKPDSTPRRKKKKFPFLSVSSKTVLNN
jgi:hypothetical protein